MTSVLSAIEKKVEDFVKNNARFKEVTTEVFQAVDDKQTGSLPVGDAARAVDQLFSELSVHLEKLGIPVERPSAAEVQKCYELADSNLDKRLDALEFEDFYAKIVIMSALKAVHSAGKSYGVGIVGGIVGIIILKRAIRSTPLVGSLAAPLLVFLPTVLLGPALGCVTTWMVKKGDLQGLKRRLFGGKPENDGSTGFIKG